MKIRQSERRQAKMKLAIQGPAGSGKTMSALLLAAGIATNWSKIAVIDTENGSADLYAHLGPYNVLQLHEPFTPERYVQAIELCEKAGMEVIVIDSISQCWDYLLEFHAGLQGNSFANWGKITPRQNAFMQKILQSKSHIIATMRTKQDYVLNEKNGKMVPEKVGLKAIQRDNVDYEFTLVLDLDMKHNAIASKDRTSLFMGKPDFTITAQTGQTILEWCQNGEEEVVIADKIVQCESLDELMSLYRQYPTECQDNKSVFIAKRQSLLQAVPESQTTLKTINYEHNTIAAS